MQKWERIILVLSIVFNIVLGYFFLTSRPASKVDLEVINMKEKIDSVSKNIDSISILINKNDGTYEKEVQDIINNSPDSDYAFFHKYIERARKANNRSGN